MIEREHRIKKEIRIVLKDENKSMPATITNFSKTGVSVKTESVLPTYKAVDLLVKIDNKMASIKGSIRWVKESEPKGRDGLNEIGISLINPPEEYLQYFES